MTRFMKALGGLLLAGALAACGGGGGSPGTTGSAANNSSGGTTTTPTTATATAKVSDFALFTDKTTIANTGADSAKVTVVAVDANRNVVAGANVTASSDQNSVFVPSGTTTDATGTFSGQLQIGGDKTDRDITLTVTINGITKQTIVHVGGSKLTLTATPSSPTPGQNVTLVTTLTDSGGNAIANQTVTLGGTVPSVQGKTVTTNNLGQATLTFAAPSATGAYTISASGSGTTAPDYQLTVFASGSAVPTAVIPAGVTPSLSASSQVLSVNSPGSTTNKSVLRFLMLDANNAPIPNVRVRFEDQTTGLAAVGASLSDTGTLYTDTSGSVSVQYIAGQNSSPTNGVQLRACYKATDFTSTTDCPASVSVSLTVAGQALAVSIGDDNLLQRGNGTYIKRFTITVADSAGRAVANAPVDISVDLTHYGKGFAATTSNGTTTLSLIPPAVPSGLLAAYPADMTTDPSTVAGDRVWCPNEDVNRNGVVDATNVFAPAGATNGSENYNGSVDSNGQPTLEPRKSDLLISYDDPTVTTTNSSGILVIKVEYSQRFATWLAYRVRATANVSGSQGLAERAFVTGFIKGDETNGGSFLTPPYGVQSCVSPN